MIRVGTGRYAPPHSSSGTPSYRPYIVSSGAHAVLAQLVGRRLVGDDERDLVQRRRGTGWGCRRSRGRRAWRTGRAAWRAAADRRDGSRGGASAWRPYPSRDGRRSRAPDRAVGTRCRPRARPGPGPRARGLRRRRGRRVAAPLPRLGRAVRRRRARRAARAGAAPAGLVVGAGRAAAGPGAADGRRGPARPGPVGLADDGLRPRRRWRRMPSRSRRAPGCSAGGPDRRGGARVRRDRRARRGGGARASGARASSSWTAAGSGSR